MTNNNTSTKHLFIVDEVVPHGKGMSLLDEIVKYDEQSLTALVHINQSVKFSNESGNVPAWIGIEYMAQAVAAWAGVQARLAGEPVRIGFLLGTRRYESSVDYFNKGACLRVSVNRNYQEGGLGVFECKITNEDKTVDVSARLNVFQQELDDQKEGDADG